MNLKKYTDNELREARKAGFKRKFPKKGKLKTSIAVSNYERKWNSFVDDVKRKASDFKKKEKAKEQLRKDKESIRSHR